MSKKIETQKETQKETPNMYIDIHAVHTIPPCEVYSYDINRPQMKVYGGADRIMIAGDVWERETRKNFLKEVRMYPSEAIHIVANNILEFSPDMTADKAAKLAEKVLRSSGVIFKDDTVILISNAQIEALAKLAVEHPDENYEFVNDDCRNRVEQYLTIDQAIFGCSVKNNPSLNCDPVVQVAQAISTHPGKIENVLEPVMRDNESLKYEKAEIFSATLYRYACVDVGELRKRIGDDAASILSLFTETFLTSVPESWESCAYYPDMIYVTVRTDKPICMEEAFKKTLGSGNDGILNASVAALADYARELYNGSAEKPLASYAVSIEGNEFEDLAEYMPFEDLLDKLEEKVFDFYFQE